MRDGPGPVWPPDSAPSGDEFYPALHLFWKLDAGQTRSIPGVTLDLHPFCGIIGVQRAPTPESSVREPRGPLEGTWTCGTGRGSRFPGFLS